MTRKWIKVSEIEPFDYMHQPDGRGFKVDEQKDGQTTEQHRAGIEYIKGVLKEGQKIRPILVADDGYGLYVRLDGFKRYWAHRELGEQFIEAFVATEEENRRVAQIKYGSGYIRAEKGGLPKETFGLFEGEAKEKFNYENTKFLYKSPNSSGLRIELEEAIHIHWGEVGKYRLLLGRKDFEALAEAISKI
jgi:hypothetical protein